MEKSNAVISRSLQQVLRLVSSDNELYASFYGQHRGGSRRPEDTPVEHERLIADSLLFPHYKEEIRFAALSLTSHGVRYYGSCSIVLSEFAIASRTTVFEENSVEFCKRHKLGAGTPVPQGYRAPWQTRDKLAAAKLHTQLQPGQGRASFQRILLDPDQEAGADFIEVHIHGPLHRRSIGTITIDPHRDISDEVLTLDHHPVGR